MSQTVSLPCDNRTERRRVKSQAETAGTPQRVVVVGSYNTDMMIKAARLPRPGETVIGGTFASGPGGKGANQAVAASRAGASVMFVARLGADTFGDQAVLSLKNENVLVEHVVRDPAVPTGTAWIVVDDRGENAIVVASGANARLSVADVLRAKADIAGVIGRAHV